MKKRFYTFTTITDGVLDLDNFTQNLELPEEAQDDRFYITVNLKDNTKIEYLSYFYYNTVDYWDLLLLINGMTDIMQLPRDIGYVIEKRDEMLAEHLSYFKIEDNEENADYIAAKSTELEAAIDEENEAFRNFKIIRSELITDFLKIIDDYLRTQVNA